MLQKKHWTALTLHDNLEVPEKGHQAHKGTNNKKDIQAKPDNIPGAQSLNQAREKLDTVIHRAHHFS